MKDITKSSLLLLALLLFALTYGCTQEQKKPKITSAKQAELKGRLERLDILYEILLKDDPPQSDTLPFRRTFSRAEKEIKQGELEEASAHIREAEQWILEAREKYYHEHESRIVAGASEEAPDSLMKEAMFFLEKARSEKAEGDQWAADQYFQAAIEQGELSLLAVKRSPGEALKMIELTKNMETIYMEAGKPDRAEESRRRVIQSLNASINVLGRRINDRLEGKAQGFDEKTMEKGGPQLQEAIEELRGLNQTRNRIIAAAEEYAPESIQARDYTAAVSTWISRKKRLQYQKPESAPKTGEEVAHDKDDIIKRELAEHNQLYKQGAEPIKGTGISLRETDIYIQGKTLIIRGELQNFRTEPILNPRITVVGYVYSEVQDLEYKHFDPLMSTVFHIPISGFNADALQRQGIVPPHQLVLIFEEPNGIKRKVITPTMK